MPRPKVGCQSKINGKWYARITYWAEDGKRKEIKRVAENKNHAKEICRLIITELETSGDTFFKKEKITFNDLADFYEKNYITAPVYASGKKVSGLKSYKNNLLYLKTLRSYFGTRKLTTITIGHIKKFKAERLTTESARGTLLSLAHVNRELALLRTMFRVAVRERWLPFSPIQPTDKIITTTEENKRERILSIEEEQALLETCIPPREHLKVIVIIALDCGLRKTEILKLTWLDVNFNDGILTVRASNSKTEKERFLAMTTRIKEGLKNLYPTTKKNGVIFGITSFREAFQTACALAKIKDLRFHDLRHTCATRLISNGLSLTEVSLIMGHSTPGMSYRYTNMNQVTQKRAAEIMNQLHSSNTEVTVSKN